MLRALKVIVPVLPTPLPPKTAPVPPELFAVVLPKLSEALLLVALIPMPVGFVIVVVPIERLPATVVRVIPVVLLLVEEALVRIKPDVTLLRLRAGPDVALMVRLGHSAVPVVGATGREPLPGVMLSAQKLRVEVPLLTRLTRVPADVLLTVVFPKLRTEVPKVF